MTPTLDRVRRHRERAQLERAAIAAALALSVPLQVLAGELAKLPPKQLEALKWALAEVAPVTPSCNGRRPLDAYFTPRPVASAIVDRVVSLIPIQTVRTVLEPSAGLGAFVRTTWSRYSAEITAVDIKVRSQLRNLVRMLRGVQVLERDFLAYRPRTRFDLVIGNPPFRDAERHIRHALDLLAPGGHLAFLLRAGFIGSSTRARGIWARPGLRYWAPIAPRPSFDGRGTDKSEYALYLWQQGYSGAAELGPAIVWRDAPELRGAA